MPLLDFWIIQLGCNHFWQNSRVWCATPINWSLTWERHGLAIHWYVYLKLWILCELLLLCALLHLFLSYHILWIEILYKPSLIVLTLRSINRCLLQYFQIINCSLFRVALLNSCRVTSITILFRGRRIWHDCWTVESVCRLQAHLLRDHHATHQCLVYNSRIWLSYLLLPIRNRTCTQKRRIIVIGSRNLGIGKSGCLGGNNLLLRYSSTPVSLFKKCSLRLILDLLCSNNYLGTIWIEHMYLCRICIGTVGMAHYYVMLLVHNHLRSLRHHVHCIGWWTCTWMML